MNTIEEPQPDAYEIAGFTDRVFARAVDGFLMSCIFFMLWILVGVVGLWLVFASDIDDGDGTALFVLLVIAALVLVVLYEVHPTARRGSSVGKNIIDVVVIRWSADNDAATRQPFPSYGQSFIRWLVPHSVLFAGLTVLWQWSVFDPDRVTPLIIFIGPVGWVLIYLTSLLDKDGRGWHDKIAGTVVVKAPHPTPPVRRDVARDAPPDTVVREASPEPVDRWDMKASAAATSFMSKRANRSKKTGVRRQAVWNALFAVVFVAVCVLTVKIAFFGGPGFDRYDDSLRGTHEINGRVAFGQRIGPDGDGCWPENWRNNTGRVFCDLVSIGGLHWDTGDIKVKASSTIHLGSGHLCLADTNNAPWCWEWSSDVPPRPARVPDIAEFHRIMVDGDFLCGQTPDYASVACWTIGGEQSEYWEDIRQVNLHVPELTVFNPESIVFNPSDGGSYFAAFQRDGQMRYVSEFTAR